MGLDMDFSKLRPQDALDLAMYAEREAEENYEHLASVMDRESNPDAAAFFRRMAGWERRHHDQIERRRQQLFGDAPATLTDVTFWEIEIAEVGKSSPSLPEALRAALAAEVNAHDYYAGAIEQLTEPAVESLFEELRQAELEHQRLLREEMARRGI
jgi:rubrerythrin